MASALRIISRLFEIPIRDFAEGEVRTIMVGSQPLFGNNLDWRVGNAKSG